MEWCFYSTIEMDSFWGGGRSLKGGLHIKTLHLKKLSKNKVPWQKVCCLNSFSLVWNFTFLLHFQKKFFSSKNYAFLFSVQCYHPLFNKSKLFHKLFLSQLYFRQGWTCWRTLGHHQACSHVCLPAFAYTGILTKHLADNLFFSFTLDRFHMKITF